MRGLRLTAYGRCWFFCCLGIGFMFLELGFIQRLSIYLGHPMYTLAVVLAGILIFTGIGSYYAGTRQSIGLLF